MSGRKREVGNLTQLHTASLRQEDVPGLDVSVNAVVAMKIDESL